VPGSSPLNDKQNARLLPVWMRFGYLFVGDAPLSAGERRCLPHEHEAKSHGAS
jgi:hypothetical protein